MAFVSQIASGFFLSLSVYFLESVKDLLAEASHSGEHWQEPLFKQTMLATIPS